MAEQIKITLPNDLAEELQALCDVIGISKSERIRGALEADLRNDPLFQRIAYFFSKRETKNLMLELENASPGSHLLVAVANNSCSPNIDFLTAEFVRLNKGNVILQILNNLTFDPFFREKSDADRQVNTQKTPHLSVPTETPARNGFYPRFIYTHEVSVEYIWAVCERLPLLSH